MKGLRLPYRERHRSLRYPHIAGPIMASMAPIVKTRPHQVFFSPPGTTAATCMGNSRNRRMNHLKLVANQNAEMRKYQALVSWNTFGESSSGDSFRTMVTSVIRVQAFGRSGVSLESDG